MAADLILLPASTYQPPSPPQARKKARQLNTIIEEDEDMARLRLHKQKQQQLYQQKHQQFQLQQQQRHQQEQQQQWPPSRRRQDDVAQDKIDTIEQWLSPLSDHFPTPRGFHFLAAPILPSSPSTASAEESNASPTSSTARWNRSSMMTDVTEFDDIYDATDDEGEQPQRREQLRASGISRKHSSTRRVSRSSSRKTSLPQLVIPTSPEASLKKLTSPVPPTPPSKVTLSPQALSFMQAHQSLVVPTISAPPSLDGSLSSDQMAQLSAPPTPVIGSKDEDDEDWSGVRLQPGALETLEALSGTSSDVDFDEQQEPVIELPSEEMEMRQAPPRLITNLSSLNHAAITLSPAPPSRLLAGLSKLDIPSPGGFFSDLSSASRSTWNPPQEAAAPPTSTTAEEFYKLPWHADSASPLPPPPPRPLHMPSGVFSPLPVEQVVEVQKPVVVGDLPTAIRVMPTPEPVTARRVPLVVAPSASSAALHEPSSPVEDIVATEIVEDYDPEYARKQQAEALSHFGRTELWLMAQRSYLNGVIDIKEPHGSEENNEVPQVPKQIQQTPEIEQAPVVPPKDQQLEVLAKKKTVRFSELPQEPQTPRLLPNKLIYQESAYYRAFTDFAVRTHPSDVFIHQFPRFEALQAQRVSLRALHRNQLLGKFQLSVVPQSAKKRMSANVARGDDVLPADDPARIRAEKEADALVQMATAQWHVAANKLLNGNRLIAAPVHKRLARLSRMAPGGDGMVRDRARILDLGGQATCDWAWHVALQYPNTKIYSVTTKAIRQLSNANIRGPPNHRQVAVERLTRLPFGDGQFDLIRSAELQSLLKTTGENGEDEWEGCLRECFRVLKPGGYIEFQVLDSDIVNAGPLGHAKSVEFGFALSTLGYDPSPSRMFLGRLDRAGFEDVRRAWSVLPMGPKPRSAGGKPTPPLPNNGAVVELEAMVSGSADHVAAATGLAAGWSWERWLLRAGIEKSAGEMRLADTVTGASAAMREGEMALEGVHAVVEEGRAKGSGYRMLKGWARKPRAGMGMINLVLDLE